jgi:hypothetical protein
VGDQPALLPDGELGAPASGVMAGEDPGRFLMDYDGHDASLAAAAAAAAAA